MGLRRIGHDLATKGFPESSVGKESACNAGYPGSIPGSGRSPGERKGYPLQYSGLENSTDSIVHGVANSQTRLSDFHLRAETVLWNTNCSKAPCPQRFSTRMSKSMTWGSDFNASSPWVTWEFSHPPYP